MKSMVARSMFLLGAMVCCSLVQAGPDNAPPARKLAGYASYELKPVQLDAEDAGKKGKDVANAKIQEHFDALVAPLVAQWNAAPHGDGAARLVIEPRVDSIKKVGGATRFFAGALAGGSHVTMHVRIVEQPGDVVVAEPEFYQRAAAMSGAWTMGAQDNDMLRRVSQLVADYLKGNYDAAVGGASGKPE